MIAIFGAGALLALAFVLTTGMGLYPAGPWRLGALGLATLVAIATAGRELALRGAFRGVPPAWLLALLALEAVHGNWNWAPTGELLAGLRFGLVAVALLWLWQAAPRAADTAEGATDRLLWPLVFAGAAFFFAAIVWQVPNPDIDVFDHMNRAGDALWRGDDPYTQPVPDFYGGRFHYGFDAPGFPYPPLVLAVAATARGLGVDIRILLIACVLAGAWLVRGLARDTGSSRATADQLGCLYLLVPRLSFAVESAHSEPLSALCFVAALRFWVKGRTRAGFGLLGLFLASKQYLWIVAPLALLAAPSWPAAGALLAGAVLPWVPFALWHPAALTEATFRVHWSRPPRPDALTLNAWLLERGLPTVPRPVPVITGIAVGIASGARRRLTPASLSIAVAGALLVTFFTSPQAFANYYLLCAWILIAGLAAVPNTESSES